jgi:putative membrane protein
MVKITEAQRASLKTALEAAEQRTSARIAVATVPVSDHYKLYPLVYGGMAALIALAVAAGFWPHLALRSAFLIVALVAIVTVAAFDFWPLRLLGVPRHAKNWECWELAHRAFASRILAQNDRKTGILLFVSLGEHYVEVVTDRDVDRHIPQSVWDAIVKDFLAEAKQGRVGEALPKAVDACTAVLALHYPPTATP